jgi:hypothetical protein
VAYLDSTTAEGSSTTPSVSVPSGVQADDIVILAVSQGFTSGDFTAAWPSGFSELADLNITSGIGRSVGVAWKRLTGADSGSYTLGSTGTNANWICQAYAFRGPLVPAITSQINESANSSPVTATAPGHTALAGDDLLWLVMAEPSDSGGYNGATAPTDYTEQEDAENSGGFVAVAGATRDSVGAGATGDVSGTFALSSGTAGWAAFLVRLTDETGNGAKAYKGTFATATGTGPQVVSGIVDANGDAFIPTAVLIWATRQTAAGTVGGCEAFFGFAARAVSTITQSVCSFAMDDAAATTNTGRRQDTNAAALLFSNGNPTIESEGAITAFGAGEFTINWSDAPGSAWQIHYLALGGDIVEGFVGAIDPDPTGSVQVTSPNFEPDLVMFAGLGVANDTSTTFMPFTLGAAVSSSAERAIGISSRDGVGTGATAARFIDDGCIGYIGVTAALTENTADFTTMDTGGFTVNVSASSGSRPTRFLALRGGSYAVGTETQPTSPTTEALSGFGFPPVAVLLAGAGNTATGLNTSLSRLSIGAGDGTHEGGIATDLEDGVGSPDSTQLTSTTKAMSYVDQAGATLSEADLQSLDADGFTLNWTTADANARLAMYVAFGPAEVVIPPPTPPSIYVVQSGLRLA